MANVNQLAAHVTADFRNRVHLLKRAWEVDLFRALLDSLLATPAGAVIAKEYHGNRYQVRHKTVPSVGLGVRACEICDLLLIALPTQGNGPIRLTYLQAKRDGRDLSVHPNGAKVHLSANLVQWSLLSSQPIISPQQSFLPPPPPNLLASALLPSVGSFGFFYPTAGTFELLYAPADTIQCVTKPGRRHGTVAVDIDTSLRQLHGHRDLRCARELGGFLRGLFSLVVGTPVPVIAAQGAGPGGPGPIPAISAWLNSHLTELVQDDAVPGAGPSLASQALVSWSGSLSPVAHASAWGLGALS